MVWKLQQQLASFGSLHCFKATAGKQQAGCLYSSWDQAGYHSMKPWIINQLISTGYGLLLLLYEKEKNKNVYSGP